jgi:hypothetical protein
MLYTGTRTNVSALPTFREQLSTRNRIAGSRETKRTRGKSFRAIQYICVGLNSSFRMSLLCINLN